MNAAQRKRMVQTLLAVYALYEKELTEMALVLWEQALNGVDLDMLDRALAQHVRDPDAGRWLPKPADVHRQLRGDARDESLVAWGRVVAGQGAEFTPNTPEHLALASIGGAHGFALAKAADNAFLQRRFCEAFVAYRRRADTPPLMLDDATIAPLRLVGTGGAA